MLVDGVITAIEKVEVSPCLPHPCRQLKQHAVLALHGRRRDAGEIRHDHDDQRTPDDGKKKSEGTADDGRVERFDKVGLATRVQEGEQALWEHVARDGKEERDGEVPARPERPDDGPGGGRGVGGAGGQSGAVAVIDAVVRPDSQVEDADEQSRPTSQAVEPGSFGLLMEESAALLFAAGQNLGGEEIQNT